MAGPSSGPGDELELGEGGGPTSPLSGHGGLAHWPFSRDLRDYDGNHRHAERPGAEGLAWQGGLPGLRASRGFAYAWDVPNSPTCFQKDKPFSVSAWVYAPNRVAGGIVGRPKAWYSYEGDHPDPITISYATAPVFMGAVQGVVRRLRLTLRQVSIAPPNRLSMVLSNTDGTLPGVGYSTLVVGGQPFSASLQDDGFYPDVAIEDAADRRLVGAADEHRAYQPTQVDAEELDSPFPSVNPTPTPYLRWLAGFNGLTLPSWLYVRSEASSLAHAYGGCRVEAETSDTAGWGLTYDAQGRVKFFLAQDYSTDCWEVKSNSPLRRGWNHVALTYDGTGSVNGFDLYVNGVAGHSVVTNTLTSTISYSTGKIALGMSPSPRDSDQTIREVRLHARRLTASEVASAIKRERFYPPRKRPTTRVFHHAALSLFMGGYYDQTKALPLTLLAGEPVASGVPLYSSGLGHSSSDAPLFVWGNQPISSGVPLYLAVAQGVSSGVPLYQVGHEVASGGLNLYLQGDTWATRASGVNLYTFGSTGAASGSLNLWVGGGFSVPPATHYLLTEDGGYLLNEDGSRLLLEGEFGGTTYYEALSKSINLSIEGARWTSQSSLDLFIASSGVSRSFPLYVEGSGLNAGYSYKESSLNLFLKRDPTASLPLFLFGPGTPVSSGVSLYLRGGVTASGAVPMYASGRGYREGVLKMYTHGF